MTVTPGECHASHRGTWIRCDLRHKHDTSAMTDGYTMKPDDMILCRPSECNGNYISTDMDSSAVVLNDVTSRRLRLPRRDTSAERDGSFVPPEIDTTTVEPNDWTFRRLRLPRRDVSAECDESCNSPRTDFVAVEQNNLSFRRLKLSRRDVSAERDVNYVSVSANCINVDYVAAEPNDLFCRRRYTPRISAAQYRIISRFSAAKIGRRTILPTCGLCRQYGGPLMVDLPLILLLLLTVGSDESNVVTLLIQPLSMHSRSGEHITRPYSWILHCVRTLYDQMAEVNSPDNTCIKMIGTSVCYVSFFLLIRQFIRSRRSLFFRLMLTCSCCLHGFLRNQEFRTDRIPLYRYNSLS